MEDFTYEKVMGLHEVNVNIDFRSNDSEFKGSREIDGSVDLHWQFEKVALPEGRGGPCGWTFIRSCKAEGNRLAVVKL